jgi:hypothetical protein
MSRGPQRSKGSNAAIEALTIGKFGTKLTQVAVGSVDVNPASLAAQTSAETDVTITGVVVGDIVLMNPPESLEAGLCFSGARVSDDDTVSVRLSNVTGGAVDGASRTWGYLVVRTS